MQPIFTLSLLVFLPAISALVLACIPKCDESFARLWALVTAAVVFVYSVGLFATGTPFDTQLTSMQSVFHVPWIPSFDIDYFMGIDGISLPLVILTTFVSLLAMAASTSKSITKHMKAYCVLFLLLETGMIGVFLALDFFLFYVFWEVMLLPMYFLIGIWGGSRREYAAIKFFLYTLVGSVLMLIAILLLYFNSDLTQLTEKQLTDCYVSEKAVKAVQNAKAANEGQPVHTFNLLALMQIGQTTDCFSREMLLGWSLQTWSFLLLFIGFAIKVPSVPLHTWLPDAHVEAPTPISMILAGVLLKMGGYGIIRICYPICPEGGYQLAWFVCAVGVVSMVYGAFAALAQKDFKRLVAYSSVSHMGYVVVGFGVWSASAPFYNGDYWNMGINGAMFQMIGHGVSSAGMFFMVGVLYDRVHHRNLDEFGGLFSKMPVYSGLAIGIFFAGLGLPGLCGFIGEVLVVLSIWNFSKTLAILSAAVVILTAGYILWTLQRVYLGAEYHGPHEEALTPSDTRENLIAGTLLAFAILLGVLPYQTVLRYMEKTIDHQVESLTEWKKKHEADQPLQEGASARTPRPAPARFEPVSARTPAVSSAATEPPADHGLPADNRSLVRRNF